MDYVEYKKLVRDNIPDIIKAQGKTPMISTLSELDYKKHLENKLLEECNEAIKSNEETRLEELADVLEVVKALCKLNGNTFEELEELRAKKEEKNGAFNKRIFLENVIIEKQD
jgi:predicted house-cleaning noncanonical NTP pyrophosphatase (MazG superfamily)